MLRIIKIIPESEKTKIDFSEPNYPYVTVKVVYTIINETSVS